MGDAPATFDDSFESRPGPKGTRFREIRTFPIIDSTNRYLKDQAMEGEREGLVVIARHQSAGRGRNGRVWDSKPGASLLLSVLLRSPLVDGVINRSSMAMGLAITDACKTIGGFDVHLKWPNDVIDSNDDGSYRKLAGVLGEAIEDDGQLAVIVGAGVNLNWGTDLPDALQQTAVSADELAKDVIDIDAFTEALLRALHERLARPSWLTQAYRERCATLGQRVDVTLGLMTIVGEAIDVDDDGALLVRDDSGVEHIVLAGEVTHLRPEIS